MAEAIEDGVNGHLVDFFDIDAWVAKLTEVLADPAAQTKIRENARASIIERYDLQSVCLPKLMQFVEGAGAAP